MNHITVPLIMPAPVGSQFVDLEHAHLGYCLARHKGLQRVTAGRISAVPDIDLNDYECEAVVDFIDLSFEIGTAGEAQAINI